VLGLVFAGSLTLGRKTVSVFDEPVLYAAVLTVLCGQLFTVLEVVWWPLGFNWLEHLSYAVAGVLFVLGVWRLTHRNGRDREEGHG
jgi:hypothetical protein